MGAKIADATACTNNLDEAITNDVATPSPREADLEAETAIAVPHDAVSPAVNLPAGEDGRGDDGRGDDARGDDGREQPLAHSAATPAEASKCSEQSTVSASNHGSHGEGVGTSPGEHPARAHEGATACATTVLIAAPITAPAPPTYPASPDPATAPAPAPAAAQPATVAQPPAGERASMHLLLLMRDVREARLESKTAFLDKRASGVLQRLLPDVLAAISSEDATAAQVGTAMRSLADAMARVAKDEEPALLSMLGKSGALAPVVLACCSIALTEENAPHLAAGLVILGNAAFFGGTQLVIDAAGVELIVRMLCASPIAPLIVRQHAALALCHVVRTRAGLRSIPLADRTKLFAALQGLLGDPAAHNYARRAIRSLRSLRFDGGAFAFTEASRQRADVATLAAVRIRQAEALERSKDVASHAHQWAARKIQEWVRLRRDARRGAEAMRQANLAARVIARTARGRTARIVRQFGGKLNRLRTARKASQAEAIAEHDGEETRELLLDALNALPDTDAQEAGEESGAAKDEKRPARARCAVGCSCCGILLCKGLCRRRVADRPGASRIPETSGKERDQSSIGVAGVLRWAIGWIHENYPTELWQCLLLIAVSSIYRGVVPLLMDHLFNVIMPNLLNGHPCEIDLGVIGSVIVLGSVGIIWIDHMLSITKMDGSGFVPVLQKQLAEHISALPQVNFMHAFDLHSGSA